jgi:hypothetical protein
MRRRHDPFLKLLYRATARDAITFFFPVLATLAASDNPAAWALAAWMRQRRPGRVELRLRLVEKILRFVRDENYRRLLLDAVRTYFTLSKAEQAEERDLLQSRAWRGEGDVADRIRPIGGKSSA